MPDPSSAFRQAVTHHQRGELDQAEAAYRSILASEPEHSDTLHHLGIIVFSRGDQEQGLALMKRSLANFAQAPVHFLTNYGEHLRVARRLDEALDIMLAALRDYAENAVCHGNLAAIWNDMREPERAISAYHTAALLDPENPKFHTRLATVLKNQMRIAEAMACADRALALDGNDLDALVIKISTLNHREQFQEAARLARRILQAQPDHAYANNELGYALQMSKQPDEALAAYRRALASQPNLPSAWNNIANILKNHGRAAEAIEYFEQACNANPTDDGLVSNLLYTLHFLPLPEAEIRTIHEKWCARWSHPPRQHHNNPDPSRKLKIGYLSPYFWNHVNGRLSGFLLDLHDREKYDITVYAQQPRSDHRTPLHRAAADHWTDITTLSPNAVCDLIVADGIDVLIDLAQHMAYNRIRILAMRPAPVQISFLGYPASTHLSAIPWHVSDVHLDPAPAVPEAADAILRLPHTFWCYEPIWEEIEPNPLPALRNGYVTFGNMSNLCKTNDRTFRLWSGVLAAVPRSRMLILADQGSHRERFRETFLAHGISPERIDFVPSASHPDFLSYHHRIDINLDTFPYNGHTTTLEGLWMGVPVVTITGDSAVSRAGFSQLSNLGLESLSASDEESFVSTATELAADLPRLAELRATLRPRMEASPLMDLRQYTADLEGLYRRAWVRWTEQARHLA